MGGFRLKHVALSGAGGQIGQILRPALLARHYPLRSAGGRAALTPLAPTETVTQGDLRDSHVVDQLLDGIDVLIHMAGTSVERPLPEIIENNLVALHQVYEGARRHRVKRVVFASSNHAIGMHAVTSKLDATCDFRPDGFYGLSKMWGEGMGRLYWDKHGIETISLRIGSMLPRPTELRHLSTWLGLEDGIDLITACIEAPEVGYATVWGVSANTRRYWGDDDATRIGYRPRQNAEDFSGELLNQPNPLSQTGQRFQGGSFAAMDFTPEDQRP